MMKSVISSQTNSESKNYWATWHSWVKDRGLDFVEKKRPQVQVAVPAQSESEDFTREADLKALLQQHEVLPNHTVSVDLLLNLSVKEFFDLYLKDEAEFSNRKWWEVKGDLNIVEQ
jgi:hypothetical protein